MSNVYFQLSGGSFSQDWSDTGLITVDNNWANVPSIQGFNGGSTGSTGTNPQTVLTDPAVNNPQVFANKGSTTSFTSGGVAEFDGLADPTIALQGSGSARAPSIVLYMDSTGQQNVTLQFDARDVDGGADNSTQQVAVQYRIGGTGTWTNLPDGYIADASTGGSASQVTHVNVLLPSACDNQAQLEIRILTTDAVGSDEWIGIDNISVTSAAGTVIQHGAFGIDDVTQAEGNAGTTDMTFTVTRAGGSTGSVTVDYSVAHGTTDGADVTLPSGTLTFADGELTKTITVTVSGDTVIEGNESFFVNLSNATGGATIGGAQAIGTITNDDYPPLQNVWINEFHYDPSTSPETGEFIEVAGNAGIDLSGYRIVLYNGSNGQPYAPTGGSVNGIPLTGTLADTANGFGFASVAAPGFQNGAPDGIALVDPYGRVVQFLSYEGTLTANGGPAAGMTSTDIGRYEDQSDPATSLQLAGTGSSYADFTWTFGHVNTSGGANEGQSFLSGSDQGQIRIDDASVVEGDSGTAMLTFTVHRAGSFDSAASVDYNVSFGTADGGDLAAGTTLTGTVTFAAGELTQTISIPIAGDTLPEYNETLSIHLGDVIGNAVVVDADATGTIVNDDPLPLTIMQIQGEGHWSEFNGQPVLTHGVVTAVTSLGFYMQDPNGDGNANTSDGIFVFTNGGTAVTVGDAVDVAGRVNEYGSDLPMTEIDALGTGFGVTVTSHDNALPDAVLVGTGGLMPPTQTIDSDGLTVFNPQVDGADFWESLEGMRVTLDRPQVVQNSTSTYNETLVIASHGEGATNVNAEGGVTISGTDNNPEIIQLDGSLLTGSGYVADHSTGDQLGTIDGILGFSFGHYELLMTEVPTTTLDVTPVPDVVAFHGDANYLTVASYNLENLDPSDGKYEALAQDIAVNLGLPDIIAVQEMQDNDGAGKGSDLTATQNAQGLIDAIYALTGVQYAYAEIAPTVANSTGGESNGNIRSGYFYQVDRVSLVEGSLETIHDDSYNNSREPLVATWSFQGQEVTTINVHFYARSGSDSLWGANQPPEIAGDDRRTDQAEAVAAYVHDHLADAPGMNIAVLGDWNGFYFENAVHTVEAEGLVSLQEQLLPEGERYSYVFDGNSQLIDNFLVTSALFAKTAAIQGIHINAYYDPATSPSDHDPQVAAFLLGAAPTDLVLVGDHVAENLPANTVVGTAQATDTPGDTLTYSLVDNGGGRFQIDAHTGVITTTTALDHEALGQVDLVVRVTDGAGQSTDGTFTIHIDDVNEAPAATNDTVAVNEDATTANLWSTLLANDHDPDSGDILAIQSVNTTGTLGHVQFDAASQTLRYVADNDSFDALAPGATATDHFTYTVVDSHGLTSTATVTVTVTGVADGMTVTGGNGTDHLYGSAGEDTLIGGNGNDMMAGGAGHDLLDGGKGSDYLNGGAGNDTLIGGKGNDTLIGGDGNDTFVFGKSGGNDVVYDFNAFADQIRLDGVSLKGSHTTDANHDGIADLVLDLGSGGTVTLYSMNNVNSVHFEGAAGASTSGHNSMGWEETSTPLTSTAHSSAVMTESAGAMDQMPHHFELAMMMVAQAHH